MSADSREQTYCTVRELYDAIARACATYRPLLQSDNDRPATMADLGGVMLEIQKTIHDELRFVDDPRRRSDS